MPGSTPRAGLPYPLPTDQVSQGAGDIRALAEAVEASLAPILVSALPPAPYVGQRILYACGSGVLWDLVWDGAFWLYVGGPPIEAFAVDRIAVPGGWNQGLGPSIALPFIGVYDVTFGARWDSGGGPSQAGYCCPLASGWGMADNYAQITQTGHSYGGWTPFQGSGRISLRNSWGTVGGPMQLCYQNDSGGGPSAYAQARQIKATPVYLTSTAAAGLTEAELLDACRAADVELRAKGLLGPELAK